MINLNKLITTTFILLTVLTLAQVPSDLMRNCDQWKITYPDGVEDKTLCGEANNEYFFVNNGGDAIVFKAPIRSSNGTTPNSSYIRSELRERTEDGSADIYWTTDGRHVLYVEQAITHLPIVKPHLVATQIHGNKADGIDDSMVLRLEDGHLFISFNGGKLRSDVTVKTGYTLGTKHEVIFEVLDGKHYCYYSEDGNLLSAYQSGNASQYYVKDNGSEMLMDLTYDQTYFKVGNYTQSNPEKEGAETDNPENYGEVLVYDFLVEHGEVNTNPGNGGSELAPYEITKFQDYLAQCKLQSPTSTTEASAAEIINNYKSTTFYVADNDKVAFTQSGASQRTELRNETNWTLGTVNETLHANLKIEEQTCEQLTVMQIHDDANAGTGPNKPLLRIYNHTTKSPANHLWAAIKTDAGGINTTHIDLGATPSTYFDCDVTINGTSMIISIDGVEKASYDIAYWTFPSYWKNGVYLQDAGTATAYFNELTLTSNTPTTVSVSGISLSPSSITMSVNDNTQLNASITPSNADNKNVTWSSSNANVATVTAEGLVQALTPGNTTITVTSADGGFTATSTVTVEASSSSSLIPADLMRNCDGWKITYPTGTEVKQLCPEDNNEFFFVSDNDEAIVFKAPIRSDNGTTPNSSYIRSELRERTEDGSADIYWTTEGRHFLYVEQAITHLPIVKPHLVATQIHGNKADGIDDSMVLRLEDDHLFLSFNGEKLRSDVTIKTGYTLGTKHEVIFEVIDGKHYCYYSEDGNLLTAYQNGNAAQYYVRDNGNEVLMDLNYDQTYFKVGNYTQSNPDKEGAETDNPNNYGEVYVYDFVVEHGFNGPVAVTGIAVNPTEIELSTGKTTTLVASVSPSSATDKSVTYTSTNPSVASVDQNGVITANTQGTATIVVKTNDGDFTASTNITVIEIPEGLENIALNKTVTTTIAPEATNPANNLVDGNADSRLSSPGFPQTITVDLGANYDISHSELIFYQDRAYQYTISVATNESGPYTEVVDRSFNTTPGTLNTPVTDLFDETARFVQLIITGAHEYTGDWVSIMEFRVFGEASLITGNEYIDVNPLSIYPNPASDYINYEFNSFNENNNIAVYDLSGRLLLSEQSKNNGSLDISSLPAGIYMLIANDDVTRIQRFTKQ